MEELPGERLSVNVAKMRAYVNAYTQPVAPLRFTPGYRPSLRLGNQSG
jgi:hypothetical protein